MWFCAEKETTKANQQNRDFKKKTSGLKDDQG